MLQFYVKPLLIFVIFHLCFINVHIPVISICMRWVSNECKDLIICTKRSSSHPSILELRSPCKLFSYKACYFSSQRYSKFEEKWLARFFYASVDFLHTCKTDVSCAVFDHQFQMEPVSWKRKSYLHPIVTAPNGVV